MGLGHDHTHDEVLPVKPTSIWELGKELRNLNQTVLNTSDLEEIWIVTGKQFDLNNVVPT